ncbi:MAG: hypothetical protein IPM57_02670 [Oligoflexia bacterium]|nr:hypothetical protein [Oligoflexia bacterium]
MKVFLFVILALFSTQGFAAIDDFGLSYGKVNQESTSIFEENRIHIGASLVHSFQDFQIAKGVRESGGVRGFELSLGLDLFSQNWIAQALVSNYPETSLSDTTFSTNGFELRLLYERPILYGVTLHGGIGLGNRFYSIKTKSRPGTSVVAKSSSFQSGATAFVFGADYWPSGDVSAGVEISTHLPMGSSDEPSSVDLAIKLSGHF